MAGNTEGLKKGNKAYQFTSENQPTPEQKAAGHIKKTLLKQIAKQLVSGNYKDQFKQVAELLGINPDAIDLETAMHIKQMQKALVEGNTFAYNAVMDRLKGKPVQAIQMEDSKVLPSRFTILPAPDRVNKSNEE